MNPIKNEDEKLYSEAIAKAKATGENVLISSYTPDDYSIEKGFSTSITYATPDGKIKTENYKSLCYS